jgi:hypothetical protein
MPRNKQLRHGVGAKISVYKTFLPSATKNDVLENLIVIGLEEKLVSKRRQVCLTMRHNNFDDGQILMLSLNFT